MGETIPTWKPTCNPSVSVRLSGRKTSSDGGAFLLREIMDRSGVCERLGQQLQDHRDPSKVRPPSLKPDQSTAHTDDPASSGLG